MDFSSLTSIVIVLAAWFVLSRWVLPLFGIPTCMGGSCSIAPQSTVQQQANGGQLDGQTRHNGDISD